MEISIFDIFDEKTLFGKSNGNGGGQVSLETCSYSKTKEDFLKEEYEKLSEEEKIEWAKDKKLPSSHGIIQKTLEKHTFEILNAIERGANISEKVLMQYEALRIIFF